MAGAAALEGAFTYDRLGRLTDARNAASGAVSASKTYPTTTSGNAVTKLSFGEATCTVTASASGQEKTRQLQLHGTTAATWTSNMRDDAQRAVYSTLSGGGSSRAYYRYRDSAGRPYMSWGAGLASDTATYYATTGRRTSETLQVTGLPSVTWTYSYGPTSRLTTATSGTTTLAYSFDAAGQIVKAGPATFTYASGKLLRSVAGTTTTDYTFAADRRASAATASAKYTYSWDDADRMTSLTFDAGKNGSVDASAAYTFDASGMRTRSVVTTGSVTTTTTYTWDGTSLLALASVAGTTTTTLTYLRDEIDHPRAVVVEGSGIPTPLTLALGTTIRGDVVAITDIAGARLAAWSYDPYGNQVPSAVTTTALVPDMALAKRIAGAQRLRYGGYLLDAESGLYYCAARLFDPATCQWLSRDPLGADGQESGYLYCGGDPVGETDPSGLIATAGDTGRADELDAVSNAIARASSRKAAKRYAKKHADAVTKGRSRYAAEEAARKKADADAVARRNAAEAARSEAMNGRQAPTSTPGYFSDECQKGSRWSLLPSKPDVVDWALMGAGMVVEWASWGAGTKGAVDGARVGSGLGPGGAFVGAAIFSEFERAPFEAVSKVIGAAHGLYTLYKFVDHQATVGDIALGVGATAGSGGGGASVSYFAHMYFSVDDQLTHDGFYARPDERSWGL